MIGLYVNNRSAEHFADKIAQGLKAIETRTKRSVQNFLASGIVKGDRFAIVADGRIVCYAVFGGLKPYENENDFNADYRRHLVGKGSKYGYDPIRCKIGILLSDITIEKNEIKVNRTHGYTWTVC